jgi:hypothetical protein
MTTRSQQLQIRVTPGEKATLKRLARAAGQDVSSYVLARALPDARLQFDTILSRLGDSPDYRYALAELNDFLTSVGPAELAEATGTADVGMLSPFLKNYVAAMVEQACHLKDVPTPAWTEAIEPLAEPWFAGSLGSLRLHLLRSSPVPFKRRNLFVDAALGSRV